MTDLAIITPSRGRPDRLAELVEAVDRTAAMDVEIWVGIDYDDHSDYYGTVAARPGADRVIAHRGERRSLSAWTNYLAELALVQTFNRQSPRYLASLGDDHRPRTRGWDRMLVEAIEGLGGSGWAYGSDLLQGADLPTAWVQSADLVRALGWMMLPTCAHMYVDNAVGELGRATGLLAYRPDVAIEHMHPWVQKADWDDTYRATNSPHAVIADQIPFKVWRDNGGLAADAQRVLAAAAARTPAGR